MAELLIFGIATNPMIAEFVDTGSAVSFFFFFLNEMKKEQE